MTDTVTIEVTADDIAKGVCGSPTECAVALAIARLFPNAERVGVGIETAGIDFPDRRRTTLELDADIHDFINDFDTDKASVRPSSFVAAVRSRF